MYSFPVTLIGNASNMFKDASIFNCDVSNWDISRVKYSITCFFKHYTFNADISIWYLDSHKCVWMIDETSLTAEHSPTFY